MFHNPVQRQFQQFSDYQLQNFENCHISPPENFDYRTYPVQDNFNSQHPLKLDNESSQINPESKSLTLEELRKIAKAEKRKKRRATLKYRTLHASRERIRVESFNRAFSELRGLLPTTPADKKLSKIEILRQEICEEGTKSCSTVSYISPSTNNLHLRKFCTSPGTEIEEQLSLFPGAAICQKINTTNNNVDFPSVSESESNVLERTKRIRRTAPPAPPNKFFSTFVCICSSELCNEGSLEQIMDRSTRHHPDRVPDNSAKKVLIDELQVE